MQFVSNQNFEIDELKKYERVLKEASMQMKSKREITDKVEFLKECKHHTYDEKEVAWKVAEEQRLRRLKKGNLALRKIQLETALQAAREGNDKEKLLSAEQAFEELKASME